VAAVLDFHSSSLVFSSASLLPHYFERVVVVLQLCCMIHSKCLKTIAHPFR
jgi:hypothetical protein